MPEMYWHHKRFSKPSDGEFIFNILHIPTLHYFFVCKWVEKGIIPLIGSIICFLFMSHDSICIRGCVCLSIFGSPLSLDGQREDIKRLMLCIQTCYNISLYIHYTLKCSRNAFMVAITTEPYYSKV